MGTAAHMRGSRDNERTLRTLIDEHQPAVRAAVALIEHDERDVDEITSATFQLAWERLDEIAELDHKALRTWLVRTAVRKAKNLRRAGMRQRKHEDENKQQIRVQSRFDEWNDPTSEAIVTTVDWETAFGRLGPRHRQALKLEALDIDREQIAERLNIASLGALRMLLKRARDALHGAYQELLSDSPDDEGGAR